MNVMVRSVIAVAVCCFALLWPGAAVGQTASAASSSDSYSRVFGAFRDPPSDFRSVPLWVWNDRMTREQINEQLADFKAHGIGGVFIHPRPGLVTPYLSDEWLSLCRHAVDVGKRLGMKVWIYDENSYPSGFAGGHVPAQMPDAVRAGLRMVQAIEIPRSLDPEPLLVLQRTAAGFEDITAKVRSQEFPSGEYYIFSVNKQKPNPWYGGFTYVDLMRREVTEKFLDVTMNAYKRVLGKEFGRVVPGVFQDEAEIAPAGGREMVVVNYTPALFERFKAKWGYDLRLHLPSLYDDVGDWQRVRHNYYATLLDLLVEGWAKPYYEYCSRNNLVFTGHYWEHEWPRPVINPDNMAFAAYAHMPGIDILMNEFQMDTHAQFGNARAVKEIRSVANQLGRKRTMSETFGAGGWEMTFFDQKRIADWEYALGVNFMNQHLSYVTIKGARKRDHPLSFSYHEPWWQLYKPMADYFGRLSVALSSGEQMNRIVVIEPTTTAWMYYSPRGESEKIKGIGKRFQDFVNRLESAQMEYDLASEAIIRDHARCTGGKFAIGLRTYDLMILPPGLENLEGSTVALLGNYLGQGGRLLSYGDAPRCVDGKAVDQLQQLADRYAGVWLRERDEGNLEKISQLSPPEIEFEVASRPPDSPSLLFHHRRSLKDSQLLFLANVSSTASSSGVVSAPGRSCERWDLFSGSVAPYDYTVEQSTLKIPFSLPPGGSLLLCLRLVDGKPEKIQPVQRIDLKPSGMLAAERVSENVLTLDYCDLTIGGKSEQELYFYDAQLKVFKFHGLDRNPWDNAVQYKTNILDKDKFAVDSGFEATFKFTVSEGVSVPSLRAVVERPELFRVSVNGQVVVPLKGTWRLDKAFGVFEIADFIHPGSNSITLKSSPFTIHTELEPVYIIGDFGLKGGQKGFTIVHEAGLKLGSWAQQGLPFFAGGVSYSKEYSLTAEQLKQGRFTVGLGRWSGVVADVRVNGKEAGQIAFQPFELDVTKHLVVGENSISVTVYGSLRNTLGPHHNNPPPGRAWPGMFQQGATGGFPPGSAYSVIDYGLFEDFTLKMAGK